METGGKIPVISADKQYDSQKWQNNVDFFAKENM
jgi:hypothetical protein